MLAIKFIDKLKNKLNYANKKNIDFIDIEDYTDQ